MHYPQSSGTRETVPESAALGKGKATKLHVFLYAHIKLPHYCTFEK